MYLNVVFKINSTIVSGLWCIFLFSKFSKKSTVHCITLSKWQGLWFYRFGGKNDKLVKNDLRFIVLNHVVLYDDAFYERYKRVETYNYDLNNGYIKCSRLYLTVPWR